MVIEAVCDREIRTMVERLLAYQREAPIHVRIVTPWIHDTKLSDRMLSEKIMRLIKFKSASITLLVNPKRMQRQEEVELLEKFEAMGVKVHYKRNLHAKLILLDSRGDKAVLVTSANLTPSGLETEKEVGVYFLNEQEENVYRKLDDYVTHLLKETNINVKGGDYYSNVA